VIIAAAGQSSRFRDAHFKKPFANLDGKAVWLHSVDRFLKRGDVAQIVVVIPPGDRESFHSRFGANIAVLGIDVVDGGPQRADSVRNGLARVRDDVEFVVVHDAARPCIADAWIDRLFAAMPKARAALLAIPVTSTLKKSTDGKSVAATVERTNLWMAQTPQAFDRQWLVDAFARFGGSECTDEAQLIERAGHPVQLIEGSPMNIKITSKQDLALASAILKNLSQSRMDAPLHPFADDRLWR
jgi:2-C-methyl-D-erythritol 4-phosphate cytidylyltransferase